MAGFVAVLHKLKESNILGEIWVNGSFLTHKIDPEDIDWCLIVESDFYDNSSRQVREMMDWIRDGDLRREYFCDCYLSVKRAAGHELAPIEDRTRQNLADWWGHAPTTRSPKGIVLLTMPGDVP